MFAPLRVLGENSCVASSLQLTRGPRGWNGKVWGGGETCSDELGDGMVVVGGVRFVCSPQVPRVRLAEIIRHTLWYICGAASLQQIPRSLDIFKAPPPTTTPPPPPKHTPLKLIRASGLKEQLRSCSGATGQRFPVEVAHPVQTLGSFLASTILGDDIICI